MERERAELHALPSRRRRLSGVVPSLAVGTRRTAFARLARSEHLSVREAALEALGATWLGPLARTLAGEALATKKPGLVATVADAITQTPATFAPADAKGPGLGPELATAFDAALAEAWAPDLVETRVALLDAAVASLHPRAKELALAACHDVNVTVRARGEKALAALGTRDADCRGKPGDAAKEIDALLVEPACASTWPDACLPSTPGVAPVTVTRPVRCACRFRTRASSSTAWSPDSSCSSATRAPTARRQRCAPSLRDEPAPVHSVERGTSSRDGTRAPPNSFVTLAHASPRR
ncbi:MAG: hypothetical protein U0235_17255 [Polyangiaceae bacterium]